MILSNVFFVFNATIGGNRRIHKNVPILYFYQYEIYILCILLFFVNTSIKGLFFSDSSPPRNLSSEFQTNQIVFCFSFKGSVRRFGPSDAPAAAADGDAGEDDEQDVDALDEDAGLTDVVDSAA